MEPQGTAGGGGGGSGGPAPFLQKTYEMVDDSSSDAIVSWGSKRNTFVVWDPLEFARVLLPSYFKHSNFSSFIRQLNTYGFRKVDQEKWEFSNEDFVRGEKHRLRNIHRRKPIHSHSHGHSHPVGTLDSERATLEEEIDRLSKERDRLRNELCGIGHLEVSSGFRFDEAEQRMDGMMQRQDKLVIFLEKAVRNPAFVEQLIAVDFSVLSKKRRSLERGGVDGSPEVVDNSNNEGHSSTSKPVDLSNLFPQDFSNKLKLELCPAVSNGDMALGGTRNSNEGRGSSPQRVGVEGQANTAECHLLLPEEVDLMDTSVPSLCQKRSNCLPWLPSTDDEEERNISCQLKLTLASSPLDLDEAQLPDKFPKLTDQNAEEATDSRYRDVGKDDSFDRGTKGRNNNGDRAVGMATSIPVASSMANKQGNVPGAGRVNDVFWEQFLTERPGSSDNEEASSCLRSSTREEGMMEGSETWMNRKDMGAMKL